MKITIAITLFSALLSTACGQIAEINKSLESAQSAVSSDDLVANQLYLNDVTDSAADDSSDAENEGSKPAAETAVASDTKDKRLDQMVTKIMSELDADASGSLSLEEFLVGPKKRVEDIEANADIAAKITAKMTADFNLYAGSDTLLSAAELKILLKAVAPRVGHHRCDKGEEGKQEERIQQSAAEVIAKYDTDADGKLSEAELAAFQAAMKAEIKVWREKNGPKGGEGKGGPGKGGPGKAPKGNGDSPAPGSDDGDEG